MIRSVKYRKLYRNAKFYFIGGSQKSKVKFHCIKILGNTFQMNFSLRERAMKHTFQQLFAHLLQRKSKKINFENFGLTSVT